MKKKCSVLLCTLALAMMTFGLPVNAENNNVDRANYNDDLNYNNDVNTRNVTTATGTDDNNDSPWELLGLLGLVGLFGLKRRDDREEKVR
ncbi:WGxxGxxG family protein [Priestia megaterium]|uniref:WGxxGxxG family protein n=1 Tax=Priestia megaterium TaxID=1404 RepID=UPI001BEC45BF|nr:WGxxGxxG family protein [Priestia megaterium]MBT2254282.1 WGxxGxxG-CTERM domain-containing protein [Priestia megaterium]MBT2280898.1 WGxxGxxG-CTERM domain-containing protein [Priestia megaterium]